MNNENIDGILSRLVDLNETIDELTARRDALRNSLLEVTNPGETYEVPGYTVRISTRRTLDKKGAERDLVANVKLTKAERKAIFPPTLDGKALKTMRPDVYAAHLVESDPFVVVRANLHNEE